MTSSHLNPTHKTESKVMDITKSLADSHYNINQLKDKLDALILQFESLSRITQFITSSIIADLQSLRKQLDTLKNQNLSQQIDCYLKLNTKLEQAANHLLTPKPLASDCKNLINDLDNFILPKEIGRHITKVPHFSYQNESISFLRHYFLIPELARRIDNATRVLSRPPDTKPGELCKLCKPQKWKYLPFNLISEVNKYLRLEDTDKLSLTCKTFHRTQAHWMFRHIRQNVTIVEPRETGLIDQPTKLNLIIDGVQFNFVPLPNTLNQPQNNPLETFTNPCILANGNIAGLVRNQNQYYYCLWDHKTGEILQSNQFLSPSPVRDCSISQVQSNYIYFRLRRSVGVEHILWDIQKNNFHLMFYSTKINEIRQIILNDHGILIIGVPLNSSKTGSYITSYPYFPNRRFPCINPPMDCRVLNNSWLGFIGCNVQLDQNTIVYVSVERDKIKKISTALYRLDSDPKERYASKICNIKTQDNCYPEELYVLPDDRFLIRYNGLKRLNKSFLSSFPDYQHKFTELFIYDEKGNSKLIWKCTTEAPYKEWILGTLMLSVNKEYVAFQTTYNNNFNPETGPRNSQSFAKIYIIHLQQLHTQIIDLKEHVSSLRWTNNQELFVLTPQYELFKWTPEQPRLTAIEEKEQQATTPRIKI